MVVYIVQYCGALEGSDVTENIAAFNDRNAAVAYADELEENGEYPMGTLVIDEVKMLK